MMILNELAEKVKNGGKLNIKLKKFAHDNIEDDSGWQEELWTYDKDKEKFVCQYPISTYDKDFKTFHKEDEFISNLKISIRNDDEIIIEDTELDDLRKKVIEKISQMSTNELLKILNN